ncbi:MAG: leucine-rich repeat domain-containing protein [Muribaculaceae bacterium]
MYSKLIHILAIALLTATTAAAVNPVIELDGNNYEIDLDNCTAKAVCLKEDNGTQTPCRNGEVPESVEYLGKRYLVTAIGAGAFAFSDIKKLTLPACVEGIEVFAFEDCHELEVALIPATIKELPFAVFRHCEKLLAVGFTPLNVVEAEHRELIQLEKIGSAAFSGCIKLVYFDFGLKLAHLGEDAFYGCSSLTSIVLPKTLSVIPEYAFADCTRLLDVTLSSREIKMGAFSGCKSVSSIVIETPTPPAASFAWDNAIFDTASLYVPAGCINAFKSEYPWNQFANITDSQPAADGVDLLIRDGH